MVVRFGMPPIDRRPGIHAVARSDGRITLDDGTLIAMTIMVVKSDLSKFENGFIYTPPLYLS